MIPDSNQTFSYGPRLKGILGAQNHDKIQMLNAVLCFFLGLGGLVSNGINIKTFLAIGVGDGVTVSFLGLSISDALLSLITSAVGISFALMVGENIFNFKYAQMDLSIPILFTMHLCMAMYTATILTTVFIAVTRTMCVALPLQFKHTFTKSRSLGTVVLIFLFSSVVYMPMFFHMGVRHVFSPIYNATRTVLWFSVERGRIKDSVFLIVRTIIPFGSQIIIILCIGITAWFLRASSEFRQRSTAARLSASQSDENKINQGGLSGKELQVVKQVVLVSIIFTVCNTPMILTSLVSIFEPNFDVDRTRHRYYHLYSVSYGFCRVTEQLSSAVNVFVYYKYNSKFKASLKTLF